MVGLLALLDDVVALTKVAAASLDDVAGQVVQASGTAAGVVIDAPDTWWVSQPNANCRSSDVSRGAR